MIEVNPDVYQFPLPMSGLPKGDFSNVYVLRADKSFIIIDTGIESKFSTESFQKQLNDIGLSPDNLEQIIITHCHTDHYHMAKTLETQFHPKLYLHKADLEMMESINYQELDFVARTDILLRQHGVPEAELAKPHPRLPQVSIAYPQVILNGGETISFGAFNLRVIWTPGHTPGHIALYEPALKLLFSGDLVLPTIASNFGFHLQYSRNPLGDYLNSLKTVKSLDVSIVLPGHEHIFRNLRERVDELLLRHEQRNREIMTIMAGNKPKTAHQVSLGIVWSKDSRKARWEGMNPWDKRLAVLETAARLEYLTFNGSIDRFTSDGIIFYRSLE